MYSKGKFALRKLTGPPCPFLEHAVLCRERGQPFLLYLALSHMHVPLSPGVAPEGGDPGLIYAASLREMDSLVGAIKNASDDNDKENTLIWFTGQCNDGQN